MKKVLGAHGNAIFLRVEMIKAVMRKHFRNFVMIGQG